MTTPRRTTAASSSDPRPRPLRLAMPASVAVFVTASVVGVAVAQSAHRTPTQPSAAAPADAFVAARPMTATVPAAGDDSPYRARRLQSFSRSAERVTIKKKPKVTDHEFRTAPLNLWPTPREKGKPLSVLPEGGKVATTGVKKSGFAQILYSGQVRWVHNAYLAEKKPAPPAASSAAGTAGGTAAGTASGATSSPAGVTSAPCPDGSGTESGLTPSAVTLFRSVCNAFPALTTYGGYDGHGEHSSGRAIDFMINGDSALGQAVADWARAHAGELNLFDVIWQQHIWTPVRSAEGWRAMPDRGSSTANHFDHVHISVN